MASLLGRLEPGQGRESVWDYPRPPRAEKVSDVLRVRFKGETIAETGSGCRVLETSHPPVYYFPVGDVRTEFLVAANDRSFCEFKGTARYWHLNVHGIRSDNQYEQRVRAAMAQLSDEQMRVVELSFFDEKAHAEIADLLKIPLGTVKSRLRLAMARLRTLLGDLS